MLANEEGPFEFFTKFRNLFTGENWFAAGIRCPYCLSVWVGLSFACLLYLAHYLLARDILFVGLGFSGATLVLDKYWRR